MIQPPTCIHPDDVLAGTWQTRVAWAARCGGGADPERGAPEMPITMGAIVDFCF